MFYKNIYFFCLVDRCSTELELLPDVLSPPLDYRSNSKGLRTKSGVNRLSARSHPAPPDFKLENSQCTKLRRNSKLNSRNVALVLFALARRWAWLLIAACWKPASKKRRERGERRQMSLSACSWISSNEVKFKTLNVEAWWIKMFNANQKLETWHWSFKLWWELCKEKKTWEKRRKPYMNNLCCY